MAPDDRPPPIPPPDPRLAESDLRASTRELLQAGTTLRTWPEGRRDALWGSIERRARQGPSLWPWFIAVGALGGATAALLLIRAAPAPRAPEVIPRIEAPAWTELSLDDAGRLFLAAGAHLRQSPQNPVELSLDSGTLRAEIHHRPATSPMVITTPHVRVIDLGTLFRVEVAPQSTVVSVDEGRVRVEKGARSVEVGAGERVSSDDTRLAPLPEPAVPVVAPVALARRSSPLTPSLTRQQAAIPTCEAQKAGADRDGCYARLAAGPGIDAQSALVALALEHRERGDLPGAIDLLRTYQRRFPAGLFAPEVSIELVLDLDDGTATSSAAAVVEARTFELAYPQDPRVPRVALVRARLLRSQLGKPEEALAVSQGLTRASAAPAIRDEALFEAGLSDSALHRDAEADATWSQYLHDFPEGRHASEVKTLRDRSPARP